MADSILNIVGYFGTRLVVTGIDRFTTRFVQFGCSISERRVCARNEKENRLIADLMLADIAKKTMLRGKPKALGYFNHFMSGFGFTIEVDIQKFLKDNPSVLNEFLFKVRTRINEGIVASLPSNNKDVDVPQWKIPNIDWRYATGSISLDWVKVDYNHVIIRMENEYRWHPDDERSSQSLHEALDRLTTAGIAKNFMMIGREYNIYIPDEVEDPSRVGFFSFL